jgi:hypothetical protein
MNRGLACTGVVCDYITRSPKHLDGYQRNQEILMNTQLSTKLAALAVALMVNSVLIGGVAYLFGAPLHQHTVVSLAHTGLSNLKGAV